MRRAEQLGRAISSNYVRGPELENRIYGFGNHNFGNIDLSRPSRLQDTRFANARINDGRAMGNNINTYGNADRIGRIDLTQPSRLDQVARVSDFLERKGEGGHSGFKMMTNDSNQTPSRMGLGHVDRPTIANAEGSALRNTLTQETSFSTPSSSYGGGVRSLSDFVPALKSELDWDYNGTPDYRSLHSQGTQTYPLDYTITCGIQSTPESQTFGTQTYNNMQHASTSTGGQTGQNFRAAGGMDFTSSSSNVATPKTMSGGVPGADMATAIAEKVNQVGQTGMDFYGTMKNDIPQNINYMNNMSNPGMHSAMHAGMQYNNEKNVTTGASKGAQFGNALFGIPGMIGGYFIGKKLAEDAAKGTNWRTANSSRGAINPQQASVIGTHSAAGASTSNDASSITTNTTDD